MSVAPHVSYPGVYIQEVDSGVRTITAVPTAITAFLGRTQRGPINEPTLVTDIGQFGNIFGGLDADLPLTYAIRDYYQNGGSQAIIVRLIHKTAEDKAGSDEPTAAQIAEAKLGADQLAKAQAAADLLADANLAKKQLDEAQKAAKLLAETKLNEAQSAAEKKGADQPAKDRYAAAQLAVVQLAAAQAAATKLADENLTAANFAVEQLAKGQLDAVQSAAAQPVAALPGAGAAAAEFTQLNLIASSVGTWGNKLQIMIDREGIDDVLAQKFAGPDATKADLFNLTVKDGSPGGSTERIQNVHTKEGRRRLDRVLDKESLLVRVHSDNGNANLPATIPQDGKPDFLPNFTGGADSTRLEDKDYLGDPSELSGILALQKADLFTLMCIPPDNRAGDTSPAVYKAAMKYCHDRRAMLIIDPPLAWGKDAAMAAANAIRGLQNDLQYAGEGEYARNAALYFPRVVKPDPLRENQLDVFPASGIIAGVMARTDATRGVWKAPAGADAALSGIQGLQVNLNDGDNGLLNPLGINCLRNFRAYGNVAWGARTLRGSDQLADDYKYVPVRRLVLMIEESLYRSTQWAVFEPNDEPLWSQLRLNIGAFMHDLFRQGAFQGQSPKEAYFVKCDSTTTTQSDINKGVVNIVVGFAPLKPAEFVVIYIQQIAGNIPT